MTNKIIKMVEDAESTKRFMEIAQRAAKNTGVTVEEWNKAKEVLFMIACMKSKEVMKEMAQQTYEQLQ